MDQLCYVYLCTNVHMATWKVHLRYNHSHAVIQQVYIRISIITLLSLTNCHNVASGYLTYLTLSAHEVGVKAEPAEGQVEVTGHYAVLVESTRVT